MRKGTIAVVPFHLRVLLSRKVKSTSCFYVLILLKSITLTKEQKLTLCSLIGTPTKEEFLFNEFLSTKKSPSLYTFAKK